MEPSDSDWHYVEDGRDVGPIAAAELDGLVAAGRVNGQTLVWRPGLREWIPLATALPPDPAAAAAQGLAYCAECGRRFPLADMIDCGSMKVCATCKPVFFQKIREGVQVGALALAYAGFWIRAVARLLDSLILGIVGAALGAATAALGDSGFVLQMFVGLAIGIAYETYCLGTFGQTPGKMALGLKVIRSDGSRLSYGRAFGRYWGFQLSGMTIYIGCIIAGFDEEKRSLHDRLLDTRVVHARG